jgi:SAM-dependent methyltransferase
MPRSARWKQRRQTTASASDDAGGGYTSLRSAYEAVGAADFYEAYGGIYHNPHEELLRNSLVAALDAWSAANALGPCQRVLDLACGGGEATLAFEAWKSASGPSTAQPPAAAAASPNKGKRKQQDRTEIEACDPFTAARYEERTGRAANDWSFADVAGGVLRDRRFDLVIASFCLHLLPPDALAATLRELARSSRLLLIATPHKRPAVGEQEGWTMCADEFRLTDSTAEGATRHRVRCRLYRSVLLADRDGECGRSSAPVGNPKAASASSACAMPSRRPAGTVGTT